MTLTEAITLLLREGYLIVDPITDTYIEADTSSAGMDSEDAITLFIKARGHGKNNEQKENV